jgi:hypothetical protein
MKPDEDDEGGGVFIVAHFRRRPLRDQHRARWRAGVTIGRRGR